MTGQVRTVDGRVAGRRGQATRQKLLECLGEMLSSSPYRDVKVIDVARKAGTSPATFYQYFPDVEGAVLEIAEQMATEGAGLTQLLEGRSWVGKAGWQTSQELVDGFLEFWRKNDAILRVVDLGAAEGDKRFYKIRMKILNSVNNSLTDTVKELQAKGKVDKDVSPAAMAGSLVAMLAAVASHQKGFQTWGVKQAELKPNLALLVHLGVTGKKPTK
ncbi:MULTISPECIES: TetR family transcriptional regulator [Streptomyces]|jgi:AcrR family transcriptional regulator|uniref:TetR/AcrR family transcriptional regulator n=2 Tax=Streptomyces TaxID=1883 RepID=A0AAU1UCV6_9ACTN|nr:MULTISPECIES: TetR family transcriptional regulator [unclassified Streptomyces]WSW26467.1 TetR/AcrR family transcriptional regulator [Streptomyces sp. NBC_01003]MCX4644810.1 TetR/AcrR family transcriptional regulator [Streptomyces sp. NBC_01446]MCX5326535.1 TetR/AcrR family transcriptional regulator [Streptomyces sp. NBC_00120]PJN08673.1 TetR family transcriptional regulator [Streptomyces sp. CB01635]WSD97662.1 TetR/AcrR family transcriptional regulator [Streptomyces sp. NBC_01474]